MHVFGPDTDPSEVRRAIEAGEHFWVDTPEDSFDADHPAARALGVTREMLRRLMAREGRSLAIALEDHASIVFAGAVRRDERIRRLEVVIIAGEQGLVTLRSEPCAPLDALRESPREIDAVAVVDALADSLLSIAEQMEDEVEDAENRILQTRSRQSLAHITALRQQVCDLLKIAREQRGMVERSHDELIAVPFRWGDPDRRVRDLTGHLARATDAAESTRQTIAEALNLYLSIAAESLTRIATVLLPLTVVSGFFGMNFTWMVDHIDTFWAFLVFGIGGMVGSVVAVRI